MSLNDLMIFLTKLERDKNFKVELVKETGATKELLLDSFEDQEKFITEKIIPFAEKNGISFTFEELLKTILESEKLEKIEDGKLENVTGGISFKKISSFALAAGMFALVPANTFGSDKIIKETNSATTGVTSESNITSVKDEKSVDYKTIGEIIKAKPDLNKIDKSHPLNEVDNMVFSIISYLPFLNTISRLSENKEHLTLKEYADKIGEIMESKDNILLDKYVTIEDRHSGEIYKQKIYNIYTSRLELLQDIAKCERYKDIRMGDYKAEFRPASSVDEYGQFAAIAFTIGNGEKVVVFRGTDSTQAGWKENLRTIWSKKVPAQREAVNYLADVMRRYPEANFTISGHSKGGGLAIYAFLKNVAAPGRLSKIKKVYNFDGPGINEKIIKKDKEKEKYAKIYKEFGDEINEKIMIFVPQTSIVGSLMNNEDFNHYVVMSNAEGINQHDVASWEVNPDFIKPNVLKFEFSERTIASIAFEEAWSEILKKLDKSAAKRVTKMLFDFYGKNELNADLGVKGNLKKIFFNYISGKSTFELLKLVFSPSEIITLSDKEREEFKHLSETVVRELLNSFWKHHEEFNKDMNFSEKSLDSIKQLKDSDFSKKQVIGTMWTLTKEYVKKVGVFNFLKNLF